MSQTPRRRLALPSLDLPDPARRAMEVACVLVAFYVAYTGVELLEDHKDTQRAVVRFVLATIVLALALWRVRRDDADVRDEPASDERGYRRWLREASLRSVSVHDWFWLVLLVTAIGLAIAYRFHQLGSEPYGIWFDEAQNGLVARDIRDGARPIFVSGATQLPALFFYIFAASLELFGDDITSMRLVTTIAGILNVVFVYLLARELFDHRVGVIAAFFLAVMRWHMNFSRLAMHGIFAPLFMVAMFYFFVRGIKGKGTWNFAVGGVMAAIGLQGYYSFVLVPIIGIVFLLHHVIFERRLPWSTLVPGLVVFVLAATIAYAPLGRWALTHRDEFNQRSQTVTITKDRNFEETMDVAYKSTKQHLLMFNSRGDRNGRHNIPGDPMLDTGTGFLFILGVGLALTRLHRSSYVLLLAWAAVTLQSGIWSVDFEAPQAYRTVGITPAIAMLAALPLAALWRVAADRGQTSGAAPTRRWGLAPIVRDLATAGAAAFIVILLATTAKTNFDQYFDVQMKRSDAWASRSTDVTFAGYETARLGPDRDYRTAAVFDAQPTIQYLAPNRNVERTKRFDWTVDLPSSTGDDTVYLLDGSKEHFFDYLRVLYPNAEFKRFTPPLDPNNPVVLEVIVPAEQVQAYQGLEATYAPAQGATVLRRDPMISFNWSSSDPVALPARATWEGVLRVPNYAQYRIEFQVPGSATITLDGAVVVEGQDFLSYSALLHRGEHTITITANVEREGEVELSWNENPIEASALLSYPMQGHGLIASFYPNDSYVGEPKRVELDPMIGFRYHSELDDVARPFTGKWTGFLDVPVDGYYTFNLEIFQSGELLIDGRVVAARAGEAEEIFLTRGRHPIEVRLKNAAGGAIAMLYWIPPNTAANDRQVIPPDRFYPR